jgi:hypothetical protein
MVLINMLVQALGSEQAIYLCILCLMEDYWKTEEEAQQGVWYYHHSI